jgi:ATP-binding cassette subfamily C protein CydC
MLRLLRLFRPHLRWMLAGVGLSIVVILANVALLGVAGWFIAAMALSGLSGQLIEYFTPAAGIRALAILRTGGRYAERLVTHEATLRLLSALRVWFYEHLEPLAPARLQYYRGGDLLSRIRADIDSLDNLYLRVLAPTVAAMVTVALVVLFMAWFSSAIALIDLAGLVLAGVALPVLTQRLARRAGQRAVAIRAELRAGIADSTRGLGELLAYQAAARQGALIDSQSLDLIARQRRQAWIGGASAGVTGLLANASMALALIVAIPLVRSNALTGPDFAMIALFVLGSFEAVATLPVAFQALGETLAAARRVFEIVDTKPQIIEPVQDAVRPVRFDLHIAGLRMRYAVDAPWALDGINLDIPHGGRIGIIGATGSGKTSLINVLLRFWEFQEGTITLGGVSLRNLNSETLRSCFVVLAQQTYLFNTSIRHNLRLARPDATDAELHAALRQAQMLDEVNAFPAGLDTIVGETGMRLSGGQARRIAIARAFLKDAPVLLLDEPTEGLDAIAEQAVLMALDALMQGRTTIMIAHRPQSLRLVDRVVVMERGRVREVKGK